MIVHLTKKIEDRTLATVDLTAENFDEVVGGNEFVVIDFWAPWCGPCKSFGPIYDEVSESFENIVFAKVNTEEEQGIAGHFNIRSIPTLMIFRDQIVIYAEAGVLPKEGLTELLTEAGKLDMDEVRKKIAEQEEQQG